MKISKLFFQFVLIISVVIFLLSYMPISLAKADFNTTAKAMCLMEATSRRVLKAKNENLELPMASTTKIITAITAIENCPDLDQTFEVSKASIGISGTSIYLREGEKMSIRDLLYGLMLVSGNDASVAIGEYISGNSEFFVDLMNETVKKIGAKHTHIQNTHGLDEKGHYTTAYDLALISSYALQNPVFKEIVSTKNKKITNVDGKDRYLQNKNKLLRNFEGANGVKTGFTDDAGRCFVGSAERNNMTLVCSVLNCGPMFEDCASLLEEGFEEFKMVDVTKNVFKERKIKIENGKELEVTISPEERFCFPLKNGEELKIKYRYLFPESIEAPLEKGCEVGKIEIIFDNNLIFSLKFTTIDYVKTKGLIERFFDILNRW